MFLWMHNEEAITGHKMVLYGEYWMEFVCMRRFRGSPIIWNNLKLLLIHYFMNTVPITYSSKVYISETLA